MQGKYAVISVLLVGLALLVFGLLRVEHRRAQPQVIRIPESSRGPVEIVATREEIEAAAAQARIRFRCSDDEFEHLTLSSTTRGEKTEAWQKFFAVGMNLGAALPGRYPVEFGAKPDDYARWLKQMGDAGFNVVRAYTILPPEFYSALAAYNFRHSDRPVYLLQGIWAELPGSGDFFDPDYTHALKQEIRDAVDVVCGRAVLPARSGHASGVYSTDVSALTLGYLFGREWEPDAVEATDTLNKTSRRYEGLFFNVPAGTPTEVWLAGMMDFLVQYEVATYRVQRPVSFVNWLPIDPMFHSSEYAEKGRHGEFDNDLVAVDPCAIQTAPAMRAGYYAAYHVYPYYPDFIFLDSAYRDFRNDRGEQDNYAAYLNDLKRHHAGMPLLVAEFGVPSSRGNSHHNGLGMDHGGHNEDEQARLNLKMFSAIYGQGCAGGVFFAWLDEWFKRNWLVEDFSVPADRTRLWHNVQNPEQCYGMVKFSRELVVVDGETGDWTGRPLARDDRIADGQAILAIWLAADEEYCYVRFDLAQGPDWSWQSIGLAIDTYDPRLGSKRIGRFGLECANGTEFLVLLSDTGEAEVLVDSFYTLFSERHLSARPGLRTVANRDGVFVPERLTSNHMRFTPDGETIPSVVTEYGRLTFGRSDENSLADWYVRDRVLEVRLPWGLLNVSDPSSFQVLQDDALTPDIESATTPGFAFSAFVLDTGTDSLVAALPKAKGRTLQFTRRWRWPGWDQPAYVERLKKSYYLIASGLPEALTDSLPRRAFLKRLADARANMARGVRARVSPFPGDRSGAVSIAFDDGSYDQFERAVPLLDRYGIKAGFGLVAGWTNELSDWHAEQDGIPYRRLGIAEAKQLLVAGHSIAAHGMSHDPDLLDQGQERIADDIRTAGEALERALGAPVRTFHYPYGMVGPTAVDAVRRAGFWFGRTSGDRHNLPGSFDRFRLTSHSFYSDTVPNLREFTRILDAGRGKWTILLYHRILEPDAPEMRTMARHNVVHTYAVTPATLARHVRLVRNSGVWVGPIEAVGRYLLQYRRARPDLRQSEQSVTLVIEAADAGGPELVPMTVVLEVPWRWVAVSGSASDGIYSPYQGRLALDVMPGQELALSRLTELKPR